MTVDATGSPCWLCDTTSLPDPVLGAAGFARCPACGFLFQPARASAEEEARRYDGEYFEDYAERGGGQGHYDADVRQRRLEASRRASFVAEHATPGRLLEIGAASGYFVDAVGRLGWDASGIEPSGEMAARAADRGVPVRQGTLATAAEHRVAVDIVCAWHVLEHLPEPRSAAESLRGLLRPGGLLFLELPNAASVLADRRGLEWLHLDPGAHVAHYGPRQVTSLLAGAGFDVALVETFSMRTFVASRGKRALHVARDSVVLRVPRLVDPARHELMRVVARVPEIVP